jgi:phosphoenolpyruvate carboxykinase (ATP)
METFNLERYGITVKEIYRNACAPLLYEMALTHEKGTAISSSGALICMSGERTGRSPKDKRFVKEPSTENDIWWGNVNMPMTEEIFEINKCRAIDYLNTKERLYVVDAYAGRHPSYRMKIRIISTRAYHALFMEDMLQVAEGRELEQFEPEFLVVNAGEFPANRHTAGMTSTTSIDLCLSQRMMVILGSQYAGEMKKGIFSVMHYYMPKVHHVLTLHSSANEGKNGDVSIFFGLSGTGKTTLSTDEHRYLIGDDELGWHDDGVFNIEAGCYAKTIKLSKVNEPYIYNAIRFGSVLENVVYDPNTRDVDYDDSSITENTRTAYPVSYIPNARLDGLGKQPKNIILLTCDAFGVLPPVSRLTKEQAMYYFITGYTAVVAGTVVGVTEPKPEFSSCFGDAFLVLHPNVYATMLAKKMEQHSANAWLVNTGWAGGAPGVGSRMKISVTRAIIDAIHDGSLEQQETVEMPIFGLNVPAKCNKVPDELLMPKNAWKDKLAYDQTVNKVAKLFIANFKQYEKDVDPNTLAAGPTI